MTAQPQTIALDLTQAGIKNMPIRTLLTSDPSLDNATTTSVILPPFASWVAEVQKEEAPK